MLDDREGCGLAGHLFTSLRPLLLYNLDQNICWYFVGYASAVKHQGKCGSCVAFATMAAVEICYKKESLRQGDFSEQQLIDCAYQHKGADGCTGAGIDSYMDYMVEEEVLLSGEDQYPYLYDKPVLSCPSDLSPSDFLTGKVTDYTAYSRGTEEVLKNLVFNFGAAVSTVRVTPEFKVYRLIIANRPTKTADFGWCRSLVAALRVRKI